MISLGILDNNHAEGKKKKKVKKVYRIPIFLSACYAPAHGGAGQVSSILGAAALRYPQTFWSPDPFAATKIDSDTNLITKPPSRLKP